MTNTPTTLFTRARNAALVALALGIAACGAVPAQAGILSQKPSQDMPSQRDCLSRQDVKHELQDMRRLTHIDVSRTGDRSIYRISGYLEQPKKESVGESALLQDDGSADASLVSKQRTDKVRYVALFDACQDRVIRVITPDTAM